MNVTEFSFLWLNYYNFLVWFEYNILDGNFGDVHDVVEKYSW